MQHPDVDIVVTGDGSVTLRSNTFGVTYHSIYGAITESQHVFLHCGLENVAHRKKKISLLEIGFGTGLNCLLSYLFGQTHHLSIAYTALEPYPISKEIIRKLNYPQLLDVPAESEKFMEMHSRPNQEIQISPTFKLIANHHTIEDADFNETFDLIYFDAFAPNAQQDMWSLEVMNKMARISNPGAVLVTYCAKGQVRRDMQKAGFRVERLKGPPGKREMLRANYDQDLVC